MPHRQLPAGHRDPDSPFWIPLDLRADYSRAAAQAPRALGEDPVAAHYRILAALILERERVAHRR